MARAGNALKQVLETYEITQYQLAAAMEINRSNLSRWVSGERDPSAEVLFEIYRVLRKLNPEAAEEFIRLFLKDAQDDEA
jgi:transcriptional regulator with XRE-family HTH domain